MGEKKDYNQRYSRVKSFFIQETPKIRRSPFFYVALFFAMTVVAVLLYKSFASDEGTKTLLATNDIGKDFDGTSDGTYNLTIVGGGGNTRHWDGSDSNDWHTAANWSENAVPDVCSTVVIDGNIDALGTYYEPILDLSGGSEDIANLYIGKRHEADPDSTPTTLEVSYGSDTNKIVLTGDVVIGDTDSGDVNGTLAHTANDASQDHRLNLELSGNLTIDVGGEINLQGKGYDNRNGPGYGSTSRRAAHGGYAGSCSAGDCNHDDHDDTPYGSITEPFTIGSSGQIPSGSYYYTQSAGGAVKVIANGNITVDGNILANTETYSGGSGATGGSVWLDGDTVSGSGKVLAESGDSINYPTVGAYVIIGGGGRIAIYYNTLTLSEDNIATAHKNSWGGAGTIYLKDKAQTYGDLIIDNNTTTEIVDLFRMGNIYDRDLTPQYTSLMDTSNKEMTFRSIRISDYAKYEVPAGATLNILDTTTLSGEKEAELWNDGTVNFKSSSSGDPLDTYTLADTFTFIQNAKDGVLSGLGTSLTVDNAGFGTSYTGETSDENVFDMGSITVQNGGILTHPRNYLQAKHSLSLNLSGDLTMDATSKIDLEGRGHCEEGGGLGSSLTTVASHGGYGYNSDGQVYGSIANPLYLGSSGPDSTYGANGYGGGAANITASNMTLNGTVIADQQINTRYSSLMGGGSGGSILLNTNVLSGNADITASGGPCDGNTSLIAGAGGGRIALYFNDNSSFTGSLSAGSSAGSFSTQCGGVGTIYLKDKDNSSDYGTLIVDNTGFSDAQDTPQYADLMDITNQEMTYSHIQIGGNAKYILGSSSILNILSTTTNSGDKTGYLTNYGTVNFPDDYEMSNTFTFNHDAKNGVVTGLNTELRVNNSGLATFNTTSDGGEYSAHALTIPGNLIVTNTSLLTHQANSTTQEHTLNLAVGGNFSLDGTSQVDLIGKGYQNDAGPCPGTTNGVDGEACHGGWGRRQHDSSEPYGSITDPVDLGSGGNSGYGGGSFKLIADGDIYVDGGVLSYAPDTYFTGSGGSILLDGNTVQGSGTLSASGICDSSPIYPVSGGGRIALKFADNTNLFSGTLRTIDKTEGNYCAGAGTVYFENKTTGWNKLLVDRENALNITGFMETPQHTDTMPSEFQEMTYSEIEIRNAGKYYIDPSDTLNISDASGLSGDSSGQLINEGLVVFEESTPTITSAFSTYNTGTLQGATSLTLNDTDLYHSATGSLDTLTDLTIENGATVELQDYNLATPLELNSITINNGGVLTHPNNTTAQTHVLNLVVNDLTVNTGGEINVEGKGYATGYGPGVGTLYAGGGYGGAGGNGTSGIGGVSYGSETNPADLGSGAGYTTLGGAGGGLIKAQVKDLLLVDGNINAKGQGNQAYNRGAGAGGTIFLATNQFQGTGMITADGGDALLTSGGCIEGEPGCTGTVSYGGGGGGGRIAIYYQDTNITGDHFLVPGKGSVTLADAEPITMVHNDPLGGISSPSRANSYDGELGTLYLAYPDHYEITGNGTQVAGTSQEINTTLLDNNGNIFLTTEDKNFIFSGANSSPNGTEPTIKDKDNNQISFGNTTPLSLVNGTVFTDMTLYKTETAEIETTDGTFTTFADQSYDLDVTVTESTPDETQTTIDTLTNPLPAGNYVNIVVTPKDIYGNPVTATGATVLLNIAGINPVGALATTEVVDGGTGLVTYIANYLANNSGEDEITGTINTNAITKDEDGTSDGTYHQIITGSAAGHLEITGSATQTAGTPQTITITAKNDIGEVDLAYTGLKNITITGASNAPDGTTPTTRDNGGVDVSMTETPSLTTELDFVNGVATSQMYLYKQETVEIEVTDGTINTFGSQDYDLDVAVTNSGVDYTQSILEVNKSTVEPGEEVTITVITKDEFQNLLTAGGETVTASVSGANTAGPITLNDNGDGTYSTTDSPLTHHVPTNSGEDLITASVSGNAVTHDNDGIDDGTFHLQIAVLPRHIEITGSATQVAGTSQTITLTVKNSLGTVDTAYTGDKTVTFSGASVSSQGNNPTVDSVNFGSATTLTFTNGVATADMSLFTVETAEVEATDGTINTFDSQDYDLDVEVTVADACLGTLSASPNPVQQNNQVSVNLNNVSDQYGNSITVGGGSPNLNITGVNPTSLTVTDNNDGTYSSNYTPANAGTDTLSGTLGSCDLNTVDIEVTEVVTPPVSPTCGSAAKEYLFEETEFTGDFCQIGSVNPSSPTFPSAGETIAWNCENGDEVVECIASRAEEGVTESPVCGTAAREYSYESTQFEGDLCQVGIANPETPAFPDAGETIAWNCENNSEVVECVASRVAKEEEDREVDLYKIKNETCTSLDLKVKLKNFPDDDEFDFKIYVENTDTGEKTKLKQKSVDVSSDSKATLHIDNLNENIKYEFKVAASEKDESDYTKSNKKSDRTLDCGEKVAADLAECGDAARSYSSDDVDFIGRFCQRGDVESMPSFPQRDASVNWVCNYQSSSVSCIATREGVIVGEPACGNSEAEGDEECDDGNTKDGDGCDSLCKIEKGATTDNPICGEAAQTYGYEDVRFSGDFCQAGTVINTPAFPNLGGSVAWICEKDGGRVSCNSSRREKGDEELEKESEIKDGDDDEEEIQEEGIAYVKENFPILPWLSVAGVLLGGILLIPFRTFPLLGFIELFGLLTKRNKEKFWGTVFEEETKMPIMAAKITLMDTLGRELETVYSDKYGRYGFLAGAGKYVMDVYKPDSKLITGKDKDSLYGKLYTGKPFEIKDDDEVVTMSIAMKNSKIEWKKYANKKIKSYTSKSRVFKEYFFIFIHVIGFIYTTIATFLFPNMWNIAMISLYVIIFIIKLIIKKKKFGMVINDSDDKPVPFSIVNLYNKSTKKKEAFAVTDVIGRYYLLAENGNYDIAVKGQPVSGRIFEKKGKVRITEKLLRKKIRV